MGFFYTKNIHTSRLVYSLSFSRFSSLNVKSIKKEEFSITLIFILFFSSLSYFLLIYLVKKTMTLNGKYLMRKGLYCCWKEDVNCAVEFWKFIHKVFFSIFLLTFLNSSPCTYSWDYLQIFSLLSFYLFFSNFLFFLSFRQIKLSVVFLEGLQRKSSKQISSVTETLSSKWINYFYFFNDTCWTITYSWMSYGHFVYLKIIHLLL